MKSFVTSDAARVPAGSSSIRVSVVLAVAILSLMAGVWNPVRRAEASALLIGFEVGSDDPLTASTPLPPATEPVAAPLVATSIPSPDPVSDKVGASVGEFRVDESGQLSYTMPIYVPPGTSGVAPKIALIYNSQSGMSPLGKGWNLAGLSSITRCRATREAGDFFDANGNPLDGNAPPVNFSASDKFCLDGQRLIAMSGATYGGPGAEYRLELDPFTRVYSRGGVNTADDTYTGPKYFEVQRKDGSTSTYGNTTDSRLLRNGCTGGAACAQRALTWALNRMEDSTGNYIDYVYALSPGGVDASGEQVISAIRYTGKRVLSGQVGTAKSPYAQARFTYDTVSTAERRIGYQAGSQFTQSQRLSGIVVEDLIDTGTPRVLRHYRPQYVASPSLSGSSVLASVQECRDDSANVVCYPPTTFAWSAAQYRFDIGAEQTPSAADFANLASFKLGDVDGDGRLDIVWWKNSDGCLNGTSKLYVGFADRTSGQISLDTRPTNLCAPRNLLDNDDAWQLIDYNGDGRDDLMLAGAAGANWIVRPATAGVGNRATPFNLAVDLLANDGIAIAVPSDDYRRGQLADFNGDGLLDFMYPAQIGGSASYGAIHVRFLERLSATRYGFSAAHQLDAQWLSTDPCSSQTGGGNPGDLIECSFDFFSVPRTRGGLLVEFNGDGRADILFRIARIYEPGGSIESAGTSGAVFASDEMLAAVTPNVVRRDAWGAFVAGERLPAQGSAPPRFILRQIWQEGTAANGGSLPSNSTGMRLADFNGDGLTDLFYSTAVAGEYRYRLGTGVDFTPAQSVTGLTYGAAAQFADINGDNAADLLVPSGDTSGAFQLRRWQTGASGTSGSFATATALPGGGATIGPLASWTHLFADLDGDGVTDFARLEVAGTGAASSFLYTSRGGVGHRHRPREVMTQITNGYGAATVVDYQPLTNRDVYTRDSGSRDSKVWGRGSPVHDVLAPIYVVAQATSSAPRLGSPSATSTVHYRYAGAKLQGGGRGFLGFHSIVTYDSNDADVDDPQHVSVQTLYLQEFPYIGSALATTKRVGTSTFSPSACNGDIETTTRNCFFDVATGGPADPIGTTVSFAGNAWGCIGTGAPNICPEPWGAAGRCPLTNTLEALHGELQAGPRRSTAVELLGGRQQPVFAFLQGSTEISYDLGSKTSVATTNNVMCYGDDYGNATNTITENYEGLDSSGVLAARSVSTQTYLNDLAAWRLGRLDASSVEFERPGQNALTRFSNFTYDLTGAKTGLLLSERVQKDIGADQDLRTRYVLDEYGNRTIVFTCSSDIPSSSCDGASDVALVKQRPTASNGDPTISAHRYVRAEYDNRGRFMTRMRAPYFNGSATGNQAIEQTTREVLERNEFGDVSAVSDANGRRSGAVFGTLGRPYVQWAQTGADLTVYTTAVTTLRWCQGAGPASEPKVSCPAGAIFRTQIVGDGAATSWTYHDVLGRETLKVAQTFNQGVAGKDLAGACIAYDAHGRPVSQTEPGFLDGSGEPDFVANGSFCTMGRPRAKTYYDVLGRVTDAVGPDQATVSTQYNGLVTTITDPRSKSTVQTRNALGEVVATRDPGATDDPGDDLVVTNEYGVAGDLVRVKRNSGNGDISDEVVYDGFGRKVSQTDPDGGTRTYAYNAAGELIRSTDAKGQVTRQYFDALGRLWKRSTSGGCASDTIFCNGFEDSQSTIAVVDTYVFDTAANGVGLIASSVRVEGGVETFRRSQSYDVIGRPSTRSTTFDNTVWSETTTYDALGRVWTQQDASGQILTSVFSNRGFVQALDDSRVGGGRLYEVFETNARGQVVRERRGNTGALDTVRSYDANTGRVDTICSGTNCALQDWNYDFDSNGNLTQRMRNAQRSPTQIDREEFAYDNLNRLRTATITRLGGTMMSVVATSMTYDKLGNVCNKDGQAYTYFQRSGCANANSGGGGPHAVQAVGSTSYGYDASGNQYSANAPGTANDRSVTFDAQNQVTQIRVGGANPTATTTFRYGADGARYKRVDLTSQGQRTTRIVGSVEVVTLEDNTTETRRYLGGVAIDILRSTTNHETRYVFGDHQGSIDIVASGSGAVLETLSYGAYGERRNPSTWQGAPPTLPSATTRGYTGHEHADGVGLIHMNGRMYDPKIGRFIQADPMIDAGTQGLNRYSYVLNNPLTLTDPTGNLSLGGWLRVIAAIVITIYTGGAAAPYFAAGGAGVWTGVAIVAAGGFAAGVVQTGTLQGGLYGAFSAALFAGIGYGFQQYGTTGHFAGSNFGAGTYAAKVLAHGVAGGVMNSLQGGKFGHGFFSAGVSQAVGGEIDRLDARNAGFSLSRTVAAAVVGGTVSAATGGKFGNGAVTGAFSRAFNDELHASFSNGFDGDVEEVRKRIGSVAEDNIGSANWDSRNARGPYGKMTNKCNLFIHEVLDAAGADIPYMNGGLLYNWFGIGSPEYPVLAGQWADRNFKIPGWTIVESPQAGDIGAMSLPFRDATGHVGIIANGSGGGFLTISASSVSHSVVKNDWGFRNDGWKLIYRRYTGEGK